MMSPAPPLMAKVDSSTRVTTPAVESSCVTGPAKFHGSAMGVPYRPTWSHAQSEPSSTALAAFPLFP